MVSLDPEIWKIFLVSISSEVPSGAGNGPTSPNYCMEKMENLVSQRRSKSRISNWTFFRLIQSFSVCWKKKFSIFSSDTVYGLFFCPSVGGWVCNLVTSHSLACKEWCLLYIVSLKLAPYYNQDRNFYETNCQVLFKFCIHLEYHQYFFQF